MWYQIFKKLVFVPWFRLACPPEVSGLEHVPATGGAILASNHVAGGDSLVIPVSLERTVVFPAKAELFRGDRGPGSKVVATFLRAIGQLPMDRAGGRQSLAGLAPVLDHLRAGGLLAIYPEGTRSPDGRLYKGHTGVARLALAAGVPVLPVHVSGTDMVRNRLGLPVLRSPRMVVGEPLDFSALADRGDEAAVLRWVTDEVMAAIQQLGGQAYVDVYASRVKHGDLAGNDLSQRVQQRPGPGGPPPAPHPAAPDPAPIDPVANPAQTHGTTGQEDH